MNENYLEKLEEKVVEMFLQGGNHPVVVKVANFQPFLAVTSD